MIEVGDGFREEREYTFNKSSKLYKRIEIETMKFGKIYLITKE